MSEQDGIQPPTKQRRSRKTSTANQENVKQALAAQRPVTDDTEAWKAYWKTQGQPWRTEPEIDALRQAFLDERRYITSDIEKSIYPFKDIKLSRADVEWLLVTHENGRGPVDWSDERQRDRDGLDLRGADLSQVNLRRLPLSRLVGGLRWDDWKFATEKQRRMAAIHLEEADLTDTSLKGARLRNAHLEGARLVEVHLEHAQLIQAYLEGTNFFRAHLEGANLRETHMAGADLRLAFCDHETSLEDITLGDEKDGSISLVDVHWNDVNLSLLDWKSVKMLGNEQKARQEWLNGKMKDRAIRLDEYQAAVRANRQLAVVLRDQGLNEEADTFAYRAQKLQRIVLRRQGFGPQVSLWQRLRKISSYVFSLLLDLLAGYGYRPGRSIIAYLVIIFSFMGLYLLNSHIVTPHLRWDEALVLSVSSFHGRGFFSQDITLGDTYARLAATEAVVGLVIEISFIATFTQRFFGK